MAKNSWNDYSATAANNTDVGNVNTSETMNPSDVNDAVRELMSHTADVVAGTVALSSINIDGGSVTGITDLAVADGGTGASTLTANGVLFGNGTSAVGATAVGSSGQVLTSNGSGSAPTFQAAATTYTHPNHSGEVTSSGDGATVIASNVVDEDNLKVSNGPSDGYILTARSGNTGGMTWEAAGGGGASDIDGLSDALTNTSGQTIGLGSFCLDADDGSTNRNTGLGYNCLTACTTGAGLVAAGYNAGLNATTFSNAVIIGHEAVEAATTGGGSATVIGSSAAKSLSTLDSAVIIGSSAAAYSTNATSCVFVGTLAGVFGSGASSNVAIGYEAMYGINFSPVTGYGNVAVGRGAMYGAKNEAIGNTSLGAYTLALVDGGDYNTACGYDSGDSITTGSNNSCLGNGADASTATVSNEFTLGNSSISSLRCQVQTISSLSDRRDKKDIEELPLGVDFINTLKPVKFTWNMRDGVKVGQQEAGFIAQDLDEAQIDAGAEDYLSLVLKNNPEKLEASYGKLVPVLVKAVQELSAEISNLKKEIKNGI